MLECWFAILFFLSNWFFIYDVAPLDSINIPLRCSWWVEANFHFYKCIDLLGCWFTILFFLSNWLFNYDVAPLDSINIPLLCSLCGVANLEGY
jgi:hypothetical protein